MRKPATPPEGRKRKSRSLGVEFCACLYLYLKTGKALDFARLDFRQTIEEMRDTMLTHLGVDPDEPWDIQHEPPLGIRPFSKEKNDYEPAENDYRYMVPMQRRKHKEVTSEVDRPNIDRTRRLAKAHGAHTEVLERIASGRPKEKKKSRWPSRPMRSKQRKPKGDRDV